MGLRTHFEEVYIGEKVRQVKRSEKGESRQESILKQDDRSQNGKVVCQLAGWMVIVNIVRCCKELRRRLC